MDAQRWQLLDTLFQEALACGSPDAQRALLEARHGDDPHLVAEVMAMLEADRSADSLLDRGVGHAADAMLQSLVPPHATFGPYRVQRMLGEGGMGIVCLAERADLGSVAAIKVLRDAWLSPARRERFAVEQRVLAQLTHPGIARLYDAGTLADGTPWFAMEYVEGQPLTDYCRAHHCSIERRLQLFRQACEAVRFAHAHAVIHRDIKPSNILVKQEGSVHLLDFGIAKQLDGLEGEGATRTVFRLMTPAYAAPEQLFGDKVGVHTDVYSLGVVLYELLTGRAPFDLHNLSALETTAVIAKHAPARPSQAWRESRPTADALRRSAWTDLDVLCLQAMHPDPARRYISVEAVIRDIDHYIASEPLEARADGWTYRTGKLLRRHWQLAALGATAALLVVVLTAAFTVGLARARDSARAEAARTERVQQLMTSLFQGGDALAGPASNLKVIDVLDRGAREAEAMTSDPAVQAELLHELAAIYRQLRQPERADALLRHSLQLRSGLFGADSAQAGESLVATGLLRVDQARLVEAEELVRRGRQVLSRALGADHPQTIEANLALGHVLRERGAHDEAIALLERVLVMQSRPGVATAEQAAALSQLADANYSAGHYAVSDQQYRRLLAMHRASLGATHPMIAEDLGSLAAIQQDLGYYDAADRLSREALQIVEGHYGPGSAHSADHLTSLGRALTYQQQYAEAAEVLERAWGVQTAAFGEAHPVVAETGNELGNVLALQQRFADAERIFRRSAAIYRDVYGERHHLVGIALSNVAYMQMQQGQYAEAERLFRDVVQLFSQALAPDNVNTGIARIKLGRTLLRAGRARDAEVESLAGYEVLSRQTSPSISFLRAARQDLVTEYEKIGLPEKAARFREELLASQ